MADWDTKITDLHHSALWGTTGAGMTTSTPDALARNPDAHVTVVEDTPETSAEKPVR